jgi:hypothetical protein
MSTNFVIRTENEEDCSKVCAATAAKSIAVAASLGSSRGI